MSYLSISKSCWNWLDIVCCCAKYRYWRWISAKIVNTRWSLTKTKTKLNLQSPKE